MIFHNEKNNLKSLSKHFNYDLIFMSVSYPGLPNELLRCDSSDMYFIINNSKKNMVLIQHKIFLIDYFILWHS